MEAYGDRRSRASRLLRPRLAQSGFAVSGRRSFGRGLFRLRGRRQRLTSYTCTMLGIAPFVAILVLASACSSGSERPAQEASSGSERPAQEASQTVDLRTVATVAEGEEYDPSDPYNTKGKAPAPPEPVLIPTGFFRGAEAPFPRGAFTFKNAWQAFRGGKLIAVYAGEYYGHQSRGVIAVQEYVVLREQGVVVGTRFAGSPSVHPAPGGLGSLTLRRAEGNRLYFTSRNGRSGSFDIAARKYVDIAKPT
jgi:hypothetical protein